MKRQIIIVFLLLTVLFCACERTIDSKNPIRIPTEGTVPINLMAQVNSESVTLSWETTDSSDVLKFRIYIAEGIDGTFVLRDSTVEYEKTITNLLVNQLYYFQVTAVLNSGVEWWPSSPISARVSHLSVMINNDAEYTNQRQVQLLFNAPSGASDLLLSEDVDFTGASWQSYSSQKSLTLSDGDETKTVYARIQFTDGSQSGDVLSDDITLDTYVWIEDVSYMPVLQPGGSFSAVERDTITFILDAGETGGNAQVSIVGVSSVELHDDGLNGDLTADDGIYSGWFIFPSELHLKDGIVTGSFTDVAGNSAPVFESSQKLNITGPEPEAVDLTVWLPPDADDTTFVNLNWSKSENTEFDSYRIYSDAGDVLIAIITNINTTDYTYHYQIRYPVTGNICFQLGVKNKYGQEAKTIKCVDR